MKKWKVLVAEDEPVILSGITKFIEQSSVGCEVIAQACNGEEAIQSMLDLKPDIIVSDIQMPKATGLDMIHSAKKNNLAIQFIFISGYQEFSYVKEAIKYDAVDYLLKPVSRDDLDDALEKAVRKMSEESVIKLLHEEKNHIQKFFEKIHQGNEFTEIESYERFQELKLDIQEDSFFQGISFLINSGVSGEAGYGKIELMRFVLYDKVQQFLEKEKKGFMTVKDETGCYFIIYAQKQEGLECLCAEVLDLLRQLEEEYHMKLFVGVGENVKGVRGLIHAYRTVCFAQELHYFEENKQIIYYSHIHRCFENSFEDYQEAAEMLKEALILHKDQYREYMENVFCIIFNLHYGNKKATENRMQLLLEDIASNVFSYHLITREERIKKEDYGRKLSRAKTFREARDACQTCIDEYYDKSLAVLSNKEGIEIMKVKTYIKEHYAEDISLSSLADMVGMNSSYLSALFKRNTGQNYMEYLTDIRMEEAHRLLMGTNMMTYQIAEEVGYRTVRRFVETFKKKYGMSPVEYKKEYT